MMNAKFLFLIGAGLLLSFGYILTLVPNNDHTQLFDRAVLFYQQGKLLSYGVHAGGSLGVVPGPLIGILSALPYWLYPHPYSPMIFILLLHIASYFLIHRVLQNFLSEKSLLIYCAMFWLLPWRASEVVLWNISYLFFFSAVHLYTGYRCSQKKSFLFTFLHVINLGFVFQIHYSAMILLLASLYFVFKRKVHIHWPAVITGFLLVCASLIPFILDYYHQQLPYQLGSAPEKENRYFMRGLITVFPVLKSLLYWIRFASLYTSRSIIQYTDLSWLHESLTLYWKWFALFLGVLTTGISAYLNFLFFKAAKKENHFLKSYLVSLILAMLIATGISPMTSTHWHVLIIFHAALLPVAIQLPQQQLYLKYKKAIHISFISFCVLINLLAIMKSENHHFLSHSTEFKSE